jgi:hypothetical protein
MQERERERERERHGLSWTMVSREWLAMVIFERLDSFVILWIRVSTLSHFDVIGLSPTAISDVITISLYFSLKG